MLFRPGSLTPLPAAALLFATVLGSGCGRPAAVPEAPVVPLPADWSRVPATAQPAIRLAAARCLEQPRDPAGFERLGRIYQGNELVDLAARSYEAALARGSTEARTRYLLGLIHLQRGESGAAIERLRQAAAIEPSYAPVHFNLGQALLDAGRASQAIAAMREALRLDPGDASFHTGLGRTLRQAGELPQAESALRGALAIDPDSAEAHQLLGLTLRGLGREDDARPHLERVGRRSASVVRDPWLFESQAHAAALETLLSRARTYLDDGKLQSAIDLATRAAAEHPGRADPFRVLGDAQLRAGRPVEAAGAYTRATELDPADPEARAALAIVLLERGDLDGAAREAGRALAADPRHAMARVVKAGVELRRGRAEDAVVTLRAVFERRDDLTAAHVVHGEALAELGDLGGAEAALARAVELEPRAAYPRSRLEAVRRARAAHPR